MLSIDNRVRLVWAPVLFCCFLLLDVLVAGAQVSDSTAIATKPVYSGWVNLGYSSSRGNVDRSMSNYALDIKRKTNVNVLTLDGQFRDFKSRGNKVDENIDASLIDIIKISGDSWLYGKGSYYRNVYRGFDSQWKFGGGYLHSFIDKENVDLSTRAGYQVRFSEVTGNLEGDYNQGIHHFILLGFKTKFSVVENVNFKTKMDLELDIERSDNFTFISSSSLEFNVNKWLAFELNYFYQYAGLPVTGRKALDERLDGSLKIKF